MLLSFSRERVIDREYFYMGVRLLECDYYYFGWFCFMECLDYII